MISGNSRHWERSRIQPIDLFSECWCPSAWRYSQVQFSCKSGVARGNSPQSPTQHWKLTDAFHVHLWIGATSSSHIIPLLVLKTKALKIIISNLAFGMYYYLPLLLCSVILTEEKVLAVKNVAFGFFTLIWWHLLLPLVSVNLETGEWVTWGEIIGRCLREGLSQELSPLSSGTSSGI